MDNQSLAFLLVALCYLQPEAEYFVQKLNLPCPSPMDRRNLIEVRVLGGKERLAALLRTTNFTFNFSQFGQVNHVAQSKVPNSDLHLRAEHEKLARQHSEIDANGAYVLAKQWLAAVDVDVESLDSRYLHQVTYPELESAIKIPSSNGKLQSTRIVPRFWVTWNLAPQQASYAAQVEILGPLKQLSEMTINEHLLSRRPQIVVPGQAVLQELPDEPFLDLWNRPELSATNIFELLYTSTAYQTEMVRRMIEEANWALRSLGVPMEQNLKIADLTESFVSPPRFGFRGCIAGKGSFFQFDDKGKLKHIHHVHLSAAELSDQNRYYEEMSRRPMLVDSNSVLEMTLGWLKSLEIDTEVLQKIGKPKVDRYIFNPKKPPSHLWWVNWSDTRGEKTNLVWVVVDGTTKNPDRIKLSNLSLSRRPGIRIGNAEELMRVPDKIPQASPLMAHLNVIAEQTRGSQ